MRHLINEIIESLKHTPGTEEFSFITDFNNVTHVNCDPKLIQSILLNLIDNAIKYRNTKIADPKVEITLKREGKRIQVTIADNGFGIPEDLQDKVFDMFFRGDIRSKGSGLGLYLVKKNVEKIKGNINLVSSSNGTTFFLDIFNLKPIKTINYAN